MLNDVGDQMVSERCLWEQCGYGCICRCSHELRDPNRLGHGRGGQCGAQVVKDRAVGSFCKGVFLWSVGGCGVESDVLIFVVCAAVV